MPDAGACPSCNRPLAASESVCVACGYSRLERGVVQTRVRPRSLADHILHPIGLVVLHPLSLGLIASAAVVALALGAQGNPSSIRLYSVCTGILCIVATLLQAKYWWLDSSLRSAAEIRFFGCIAIVFSGEAPPILRISTMASITMAICTGFLRLELARAASSP